MLALQGSVVVQDLQVCEESAKALYSIILWRLGMKVSCEDLSRLKQARLARCTCY